MNISKYKKVLSKYATGITVVAKKATNNLVTGITVNSFVSISLKPAYISWSLDKTASSYKKFKNLKFLIFIFYRQNKLRFQIIFHQKMKFKKIQL